MPNSPRIIGITGGIGSGKSTVCKILETLGARTYYADDRAKWLMENNPELIAEIKAIFGDEAYKNGSLDRAYIGQKAFNDVALLDRLNAAVHPAVALDVRDWAKQNKDEPLLLKEAALLFETGSYKTLSETILVTAPEDVRISRVLARDLHRKEADVRAIMSKQMDERDKAKLANQIIHNDGSFSLIEQAHEIYERLVVT